MSQLEVRLGTSDDQAPIEHLRQFCDDLSLAISKGGGALVDLANVAHPDLRIAQVVDAACRYAASVGASIKPIGSVDADLIHLLKRAGLPVGEHSFWSQGYIEQ